MSTYATTQPAYAYFDMQQPVAFTVFAGSTYMPAHLNTTGTFYQATWSDMVRMFANPGMYHSKDSQPLFKFGKFANGSRAKGTPGMTAFYGLELDFDDGITSQDYLVACLTQHGIEAVVYSSFSNQMWDAKRGCQQGYKSRVVVPCSRPYSGGQGVGIHDLHDGLVHALNTVFGGRVTLADSTTDNRCYYFGQNAQTPYYFCHVRGAAVDVVLASQANAELQRMAAAKRHAEETAAANQAAAKARREWQEQQGVVDPKALWNETYTVDEMLLEYGYTYAGDGRYAKPNASGRHVAGVVVLKDDNGVERAYSHHTNDKLAEGGRHSYDAFNIMVVCRFNGDYRLALQYASSILTIDGEPLYAHNHRKQAEAIANRMKAADAQAAAAGKMELYQHIISQTQHIGDDKLALYSLITKSSAIDLGRTV